MSEQQASVGSGGQQQSSSGAGVPGYKFPEALLKTPRCLIALSGLDVRNNAVHRMVWDEFTTGSRRAERKPILYKLFPANHVYATSSSSSVRVYANAVVLFQIMRIIMVPSPIPLCRFIAFVSTYSVFDLGILGGRRG